MQSFIKHVKYNLLRGLNELVLNLFNCGHGYILICINIHSLTTSQYN